MDKLAVLFRAERSGPFKGQVTAVLPTVEANPGMVTCYAHVGQHSEGSLEWYSSTRLATAAEYAPLLYELRGIYADCELVVKERMRRA
jgi:hypothetical protein